jgi:hypothetical protein
VLFGLCDHPLNNFAKREVWDRVIDAVRDGEHVIEAMAHQNHDSVFRSLPRDKVEYAVYLAHGEGGRGFIPLRRAREAPRRPRRREYCPDLRGKRTAARVATLYGKAMDAAVENPILGDRFAAAAVARIDSNFNALKLPRGARYPRNEDCGPGQVPSDFIFLTGRVHLQLARRASLPR